MSVYELFTGRRPDAPLAVGNNTMSAATLDRWNRVNRSLMVMVALWFLPMLAFADNPNLDFGIDDADSEKIVSSFYTIWRIVANSAVYIGAIVAIVCLVFGLGAKWVYIGAAVAIIGGFGEWAVQWILQVGGMEIVERTNT